MDSEWNRQSPTLPRVTSSDKVKLYELIRYCPLSAVTYALYSLSAIQLLLLGIGIDCIYLYSPPH